MFPDGTRKHNDLRPTILRRLGRLAYPSTATEKGGPTICLPGSWRFRHHAACLRGAMFPIDRADNIIPPGQAGVVMGSAREGTRSGSEHGSPEASSGVASAAKDAAM